MAGCTLPEYTTNVVKWFDYKANTITTTTMLDAVDTDIQDVQDHCKIITKRVVILCVNRTTDGHSEDSDLPDYPMYAI
jgi:hypothetical protein